MDHQLAAEAAEGGGNSRNGYGRKTVLTDTGKLGIAILRNLGPRDRLSTVDPQLIAEYRRRLPGFDEKIVSRRGLPVQVFLTWTPAAMDDRTPGQSWPRCLRQSDRSPADDRSVARGMTVREIRGHLDEIYGVDVSPELISAVTGDSLDEVAEWQNRPLESLYPLVLFDALGVEIRDEGMLCNTAVDVAPGVRIDGQKEILGLWIEQTAARACWPCPLIRVARVPPLSGKLSPPLKPL